MQKSDKIPPSISEEISRLSSIVEKIFKGDYSSAAFTSSHPQITAETARLSSAIEKMTMKMQAEEIRLKETVEELSRLNNKLKRNILKTVITIAKTVSARDSYTGDHAQRVSHYSARLARRLGLPEEDVENIKIGARLHDIGKIGFSDRLFNNMGTELPPEFAAEVRKHPQIGVSMLKELDLPAPVLDYILYHHERINGKGYPKGLKGKEIPLGAQIIGIADSFDAITTIRNYQNAQSRDEAFDILMNLSGSGFDKLLVEAFIREITENGMPIHTE
ncbi:MAG: hypothetical protein A2017_07765 [Lentisphaerae bacterium GWF2_44_16]|nr:MAG: hypothetical protein A2017_07765 [Lentisphaerae bacterium GWF2_44_16]